MHLSSLCRVLWVRRAKPRSLPTLWFWGKETLTQVSPRLVQARIKVRSLQVMKKTTSRASLLTVMPNRLPHTLCLSRVWNAHCRLALLSLLKFLPLVPILKAFGTASKVKLLRSCGHLSMKRSNNSLPERSQLKKSPLLIFKATELNSSLVIDWICLRSVTSKFQVQDTLPTNLSTRTSRSFNLRWDFGLKVEMTTAQT